MTRVCMGGVLAVALWSSGSIGDEPKDRPTPDPPPQSPEQSLANCIVREGFEIELVVAEPMVIDPVAISWSADGRLWVAEMSDYPLGMDGKGEPGGRIRVLADTNHDGRYDKSTIFLDGVRFPNGLLPFRDGLLITAAPDIIYAEDTDGDGRADRREVLFKGFHEGNQQLRVNGLRWGLDNWVYCASGAHTVSYNKNSLIDSTRSGEKVALGSRDFRFEPDSGQLDPQSGPSQYGRNRDDWGNWFGQQNSYPLWHFVLNDRYLRRNPHFAPPDPRRQLVVPRNPKLYPAKAPQKRFHSFEHSGRFTSACSAVIYRDQLLLQGIVAKEGEPMVEHAFTCAPTHNLVQHNVIVEEGVSFTSRRDPAETDVDFFASKDRWCRPVMVRTGPDGALWIVDMYRFMIEHPEWLTPEGKEELRPYYRSGDNRGRIYRVYRKGHRPGAIRDLSQLSTRELVRALDTSNGPQRDLAQQQLVWRADKSAVTELEKLVRQSNNPLARLHALCTADGLSVLTPGLLAGAMHDRHPAVRRHAVRLAESLGEQHSELIRSAVELISDPAAKVRLQLAYTLGEWPGLPAARGLAALANRDAGDPFLAAAVTSSIGPHNLGPVLEIALADRHNAVAGRLAGRLLALSVAYNDHRTTLSALDSILKLDLDDSTAWQFETVTELLDALQHRKKSLESLTAEDARRGEAILARIDQLTQHARTIVQSGMAQEVVRRAAVPLLARQPAQRNADFRSLADLLVPQTPPSIQRAVIKHLSTRNAPAVAEVLLDQWAGFGPTLRADVLSILVTRRPWLVALLDAVEDGSVARADIDNTTRQLLIVNREKVIRDRVEQLLTGSGSKDRQLVVEQHSNVLSLSGAPDRGRELFQKKCATCHRLDGVGYDLAPNLRSLTDRRPSTLLTSILDPSASVDGKYVSYSAITLDGRLYSGIVASETGNSITLVSQQDKQFVILRNELDEITSSGKSLMADGMEEELSDQDLADVIAYVRVPDTN